MMKPAGEKKRNGNNSRPKTVPRLQRVIAAAARRSAPTVSQSIKTAPPEQPAERLAVSASNRSHSYPSIGSQHTEKPASSRCKEKNMPKRRL